MYKKLLILSIILFSLLSCESNTSSSQNHDESETTGKTEETTKEDIDETDEFEEFVEYEDEHCTLYDDLRPSRNLRDPNKMHIKTGREVGLKEPFRKNADFLAVRDSIVESGFLQYVENDTYYRKKRMKHSYPYLTPEAIALLKEISVRFNEKLKAKRMPEYSLQLTSCLRTLESQTKLRKKNRNATRDTSSHVFGASFDISYWEFYRNKDGRVCQYKILQDLLSRTIREVRNEKRCLVIKETGQFCFHCTVIR